MSVYFSPAPWYPFPMKTNGEKPNYELIRSRRRTLAVEVTRDGRVIVRAPLRLSQAHIDDFVADRADWIARHLDALPPAPPPPTEEEIRALKAQAAAILPEKVAFWSEKTGLVPTGTKITAARRRYGSCNSRGGLCFSCFLMNCPEEAVDLVVVHELCHLKVPNHGPAFYTLLAHHLPDGQERKKLLK